ncbi:MAG: nucleoside hydrolase [Erysipelotrichales bacterium]|nr:nucleoside hydrolase [Erysipelotrichales bacterium]
MEKIILDCDPGHDDAVAIMLAGKSDLIKLLGITVSSGNQSIEKTTLNALNICQYLDIDVPVAKGCSHPIIREVEVCEAIHGESGLDGFTFPKLKKKIDSRHAVQFIIDTLLQEKDKTIMVVTGPLTNLALALRLEPRIIEKIKKVVLMGGSYQMGNVTPASEFNILCDPEAAHIVLNSKLPIYMVTLDVTRKVLCYESIVNRMKQINNKASDLFVALMKVFNDNQHRVFGYTGAPLHDPVTIASLLDDSLVTFKHVNTEIDLSHGTSYGRTNSDLFDYLKKEKNSFVSIDIDVDKFWNIVEENIRNYKEN